VRSKRVFNIVSLYAIAMGFMEAAVVIYLRRIYYPNGFSFPLAPVDHNISVVELYREAATIIMLISIGLLAGRNRAEKFGYFLYSFAIWDIFYYVFLKVFLGWPGGWLTWDILFLLPVPWVGPVVAPIILASSMILFAVTIIYFTGKEVPVHMKRPERILLWTGTIVAIISFTQDYVANKGLTLWNNITVPSRSLFMELVDYVPHWFNWPLFLFAEGLILFSYALYLKRLIKKPMPG
jgi:hypothetical protein